MSMKIPVLSGQACLAIVRRRLIRTKRYHDYKAKIAAHVDAEMADNGNVCPPRGSLYKVVLRYWCKGWGVDMDNAQKAIFDALIGVAIDDDRAIVDLKVEKNTHSKREDFCLEVYKIGSRPVAAPVEKRTPNKVTPNRAKPVRARRPKSVGGSSTSKRANKG